MKTGDVVDVVIDRLGSAGDGLARAGGRTVYVPQVLPSERVRVRLLRPLDQAFHGQREEILEPSPERVAPACPHFEQCGGCMAQHMSGALYHAWKTDVVREALAREGLCTRGAGISGTGISGTDTGRAEIGAGAALVRPVRGVPAGRRRRVTLAALAIKGREEPVIGFNAKASHRIIPVSACPLMRSELERLLPLLRLTLAPWVRLSKAMDIGLTLTDTGVDILVTGAEPDMESRERAALMARESSVARVSWRKNERSLAEPVLVMREPVVSFGGVRVPVPAGGFLQPSVEGETLLVDAVREALLDGVRDRQRERAFSGSLADLFAGSGCFSFPLAALARDVLAVEGDSAALDALCAAAHAARPLVVRTQKRDLFRDPLSPAELSAFQAVVFDPPRAGAVAQVKELANSSVPLIVGVSCNPVTFARDAALLVKGGYRLDWVQPIDQFTWSAHVELVARFSKA